MTVKNANIQEKLQIVREYLKNGQPEKALQMLDREAQHTELVHARGVCLLRLHRVEAAINELRQVVFGTFVAIPASTPPLYKANYLTALLLKGYTQMALEIEQTLKAEDHAYIAKLKKAVREWKSSLPLHQRLMCALRLYPNRPFELTFPPGEV
ncbi:MAG: hypothetical protein LLF76_09430 [Planctomycetaceae bacterium]|nr:hypothetical protein [Planctomycetaceae bacterium]